MIKNVIFAVCLCLLPATVFAQPGPKDKSKRDKASSTEQEVLRLEEKGRQKALDGENKWDDLMEEGAYLIQGDGTIMIYRKGQSLPSLPMKSFKMSDLIARVLGETVIVTGLSEVESETSQKKAFSFQMRFLHVWKKFGNGWKMTVSEMTMVRPYGK
jgi:hypothetical protein